jgi:4-amino-4-deoxy-L-arabinose transferase-like glycosyltransferase
VFALAAQQGFCRALFLLGGGKLSLASAPRQTASVGSTERAPSAAYVILYTVGVFMVALATLGWAIDEFGIATPYSDPIAHTRTQDEAVYVNCAIRMAKDGDWLTPKLMGRLFLFKPPLLIWRSALSIRIFGLSLFAVRLPALVLGAAGVAAAFAWAARARSLTAGVLAAGVLLCSPFWQTFSRLCYTDVPASSFAVLALVMVVFDPQLNSLRTRVGFGCLGAASVLTKSVAGARPFATLFLYSIAMPAERRTKLLRLAQVLFVAVMVSAPWHVYQALVHPLWFWAGYVQVQSVGMGLRSE